MGLTANVGWAKLRGQKLHQVPSVSALRVGLNHAIDALGGCPDQVRMRQERKDGAGAKLRTMEVVFLVQLPQLVQSGLALVHQVV